MQKSIFNNIKYYDVVNIARIRDLIHNGIADVNTPEEYGEYPIQYACFYRTQGGLFELLKLFIENGVDVDARNDFTRRTALHLICNRYRVYLSSFR